MTEPTSEAFFPSLASYLDLGIGDVEGWLSPTTAAMTAHMLVQQSRDGLRGDVCEIGVHHGKFFLVLANAAIPGERAVAVDVFASQEKNIDRSGAGDRAIFERHVAVYAPTAAVDIIEESSLDLERIGFLARRFRMISIDGGHTSPVVMNDLRLAERTLLAGGVAALDDILSHDWTGVLTGLAAYLAAGGTMVPFALTPNKLLLTTGSDVASRERARLRRAFPRAISKRDLEFLGFTVDSYLEQPYYSHEKQVGLRREIEDLRRRQEVLQAQLQLAKTDASALRSSTSWRITEPFRAAAAFALGRKSKPAPGSGKV